MGVYFEDHLSMAAQAGVQVERTLDTIMRRYVGQNPPHPPVYRAYQKAGIRRGADYRYHADFNAEFPDAPDGSFVYAWARLWSDVETEIKFDVSCVCPTAVYCNRQSVFRSTIFEERYPDRRQHLQIALRSGWNHFVLRFRKTRAGFGGVFGTWLGKLPYYFLMPTDERPGQEGWLFTAPLPAELSGLPDAGTTEASSGLGWHPRTSWTKTQQAGGQCRRIFGLVPGARAVGWTRALFPQAGTRDYVLTGKNVSPITVTIGDRTVFSARTAGKFSVNVAATFGRQDVMVVCECGPQDWGYELTIRAGDEPIAFVSPCNLADPRHAWMYLGPLPNQPELPLARWRDLRDVTPAIGGDMYWRLDAPDLWVRPYNENALYGRWNYPLGVTLYGLLSAANVLGSDETQGYIRDHVRHCCDTFHYALWDRQQYGGATNMHHLLTSIDSLDDCGSFGSCVLEVARQFEIRGSREISDYVADYISNRQARLPDGTFFRKNLMHAFHEETLWADDLYMSVPFLCRYYQLTGETRYLDDAARQFVGFRKLLHLPEQRLMSHVYDFARGLATGVPWGRGNGWVIFSLSELLPLLPPEHALRPALLEMFRELCAGYLAVQDRSGMWHQVLTEPDSYPETSCTSMFTYAFARGVRFGWLAEPAPYVRAVLAAWAALNRVSIDRQGNVHGVCRGSEFSFTSEYYKNGLPPNLNDTHGIGIVLLAGVEVLRLTRHLQADAAEPRLAATG